MIKNGPTSGQKKSEKIKNKSLNFSLKIDQLDASSRFEPEVYMTKGAGTVHWMAPEVVNGTTYTEMADAFSFAMIAYEARSLHKSGSFMVNRAAEGRFVTK